MKKLLLLTLLSAILLYSCEREPDVILAATCDPETERCIRVVNNTGFLLRNIEVSLDRGQSTADYSALSDGGISFYLPSVGQDFCNFKLTARNESDSLYKSGGWVCTIPQPVEIGQNSLTLNYHDTSSNVLWAEIQPD